MILTTKKPEDRTVVLELSEENCGEGIYVMANDSPILMIRQDGTFRRVLLDSTDKEIGFKSDGNGKLMEVYCDD